MNKSNLFLYCLIFCIAFLISGCDKENTQNKEQQELEQLFAKIKGIAESSNCGGSTNYELKFKAIGSKACGGPTGYIGYSTSINISEFEDLVDKYTNL